MLRGTLYRNSHVVPKFGCNQFLDPLTPSNHAKNALHGALWDKGDINVAVQFPLQELPIETNLALLVGCS